MDMFTNAPYLSIVAQAFPIVTVGSVPVQPPERKLGQTARSNAQPKCMSFHLITSFAAYPYPLVRVPMIGGFVCKQSNLIQQRIMYCDLTMIAIF